MGARSVPRAVAAPTGRALLGFGLEWPRLFLSGRSTTSWHLRLALAWPILIVGFVLLVERPADSFPTSDDAGPRSTAETTVSANETAAGDPGVDLDLSVLGRARMFPEQAPRSQPRQSAIVPDLGNELQLHGVIGGDEPQAIIFHQRTQRTHSVRVGQKFGEFEVIEIHSMRVILQWRDQKIELSI